MPWMTIAILEGALVATAVSTALVTAYCFIGSIHRLIVFKVTKTNGALLIMANGNLSRDFVRVLAASCLALTAWLLLTQPDDLSGVALIAKHGLLGLGWCLLASAVVDVRMRSRIARKLSEEQYIHVRAEGVSHD